MAMQISNFAVNYKVSYSWILYMYIAHSYLQDFKQTLTCPQFYYYNYSQPVCGMQQWKTNLIPRPVTLKNQEWYLRTRPPPIIIIITTCVLLITGAPLHGDTDREQATSLQYSWFCWCCTCPGVWGDPRAQPVTTDWDFHWRGIYIYIYYKIKKFYRKFYAIPK